MKSSLLLFLFSLAYTAHGFSATHIQHIIKNETPFEFYYVVIPASEVPTAFSCTCEGFIGPGEQQNCDCYSQLECSERRFRLEYMKNTTPTYRLSATHGVKSDAVITWKFAFDSYWDWLSVQATHIKMK